MRGGSVPDGSVVPGQQLLIGKAPNGRLALSWGASCEALDNDYAIYEGTLGYFTLHSPKACTTGGSLSKQIIPGAGDRYYLVVPHNGLVEGSYGVDGAGNQRPASRVPCLPQAARSCE